MGSKKAAECDLDGSMTAFCILNGENGKKRYDYSNTMKMLFATREKP